MIDWQARTSFENWAPGRPLWCCPSLVGALSTFKSMMCSVGHRHPSTANAQRLAMKFVEWSMQGVEVVNCNCATGCPCQFNSLPTYGNCCAWGFVQIDKGHFGDVPLDGLRWGILGSWPGAIHQGNGTFQTIVDDKA